MRPQEQNQPVAPVYPAPINQLAESQIYEKLEAEDQGASPENLGSFVLNQASGESPQNIIPTDNGVSNTGTTPEPSPEVLTDLNPNDQNNQ